MLSTNIFYHQVDINLPDDKLFYLDYNYYYLKAVYQLINKYNCNYYWINPVQSADFLSNGQKQTVLNDITHHSNLYIRNMKSNILSLGNDIIEKGMFVPFFGLYKSSLLCWGKHRFYSLIKTKNNSKKFLFIDMYPFQRYFSGQEDFICDQFKEFSEYISANTYYYKDKITPALIFNNENKWNDFINSPFPIRGVNSYERKN